MATLAKTTRATKSPRATASRQPRKPSAKKSGARSAAPERQRMIEEAAYFRAEKRGFAGQQAMDDWLNAEAEIDRMLGK